MAEAGVAGDLSAGRETTTGSGSGLATSRLPVPVVGAVLSSAAMIVGWNWDISWHRSIGRDTVWTLPHNAIYVALAIAFAYNVALVLSHTFGKSKDLPAIRIWGFRGPSGSFITLWGILMQFMGIVYDDWWHGIYGLDIGVFSPAHAVVGFGIQVFYFGQFALIAQYRNSILRHRPMLTRWAIMLVWSFFLGHAAITVDPSYGPLAVRSYAFLISSATIFPLLFVMIDVVLDWKWASTVTAGLYMLGTIVMMQVFQLFPAEPKFGPVYHQVPNFLPPAFPLLLVVPALLVSLVLARTIRKRRPVTVLAVAVTFVLVFNGTNWITSAFMTSSLAENRIFGGVYPGSFFEESYRVTPLLQANGASVGSVLIAVGLSCIMAWFGLGIGGWLRKVMR
jgi:hypothetical protein